MKNKVDIFYDNGDVVVTDSKGNETFRKPKTRQTVAIANALYMHEKYNDREIKNELIRNKRTL